MQTSSRWLFAVFICFLARAVFYCTVLPLWEGYDEYSHFGFVQYVASHHDLPDPPSTNTSLEVEESLRLAPVPWMLRDVGPEYLAHDAYWQLSVEERQQREHALLTIPPGFALQYPDHLLPLYEAKQAPLYYWFCSIPYRTLAQLPLVSRVWLLRLLSVLVASVAVPLSFVAFRRLLGCRPAAIGATCVVAAMPGLMTTICRVSNESLALVLGTLCLLLAVSVRDWTESHVRALALGLAVGLALLTKAYFLALLPPLFFLCVLPLRKGWNEWNRAAVRLLTVLGPAALIAGWWYARNWVSTGSLSGEQIEVALRNESIFSLVSAASPGKWLRSLDFVFLSHIWLGNWSFLVVRSWMYHFLAAVAGLSVIGLVIRLKRRRSNLAALAAFYLTMLAALAYHGLLSLKTQGYPATMGYYLYSLVVAEVTLAIVGLQELVGEKAGRIVPTFGVLCFALLDLFGMHVNLLPYYAGLIRHLPNGNLPAFHASDLGHVGLIGLFERLAFNKPWFLASPTIIYAIWICYLLATLALPAISFMMARRVELSRA